MQQEFTLNQNGNVIWLYGLSGAGKTTISLLVKQKLMKAGYFVIILDGDELRAGINKNLSFTFEDRSENIRRIAEMAKLLMNNSVIVICALITPLQEQRTLARNIIKKNYYEIFVDCPFNICEQRDVKGLYKLSREKKLKNFTGADSGFELSTDSDLILSTANIPPDESAAVLFNFILNKLV